jgi:hypothetical protein
MKKSKSKQDELDPVSTGLPTEVVVAEDTQETESESDGDDVNRTNASTELLAEQVAASKSNDEGTLEETIPVSAKNNDSDSKPIGNMLGQAQFAMDVEEQILESKLRQKKPPICSWKKTRILARCKKTWTWKTEHRS